MKLLYILLITSLLAGCATTGDLLTTNGIGLNDHDRKMISIMAHKTVESCFKTHYTQQNTPTGANVSITDLPRVSAYYRSNTDWFKIDIQTAGIWDSVYMNYLTRSFICGTYNWNKSIYADAIFKKANVD
jgi:hypothetical protein